MADVLFRPARLFAAVAAAVSTQTLLGQGADRPLKLKVPLWLRVPLPLPGAQVPAVGSASWVSLAAGAGHLGAALCVHRSMDGVAEAAVGPVVLSVEAGGPAPSAAQRAAASAVELWLPPLRAAAVTSAAAAPSGEAPLPAITSSAELAAALAHLRALAPGVPVGVRILAGFIEGDLEELLGANPDFIVLVGRGASVPLGPAVVRQNAILPLPHALARARAFLDARGAAVALVASGGIRLPFDIAVAIALGADAVEVSTLATVAATAPDRTPGAGGERLHRVLGAYMAEVEQLTRLRGHGDVHALSPADLCSPLEEIARALRVQVLQAEG